MSLSIIKDISIPKIPEIKKLTSNIQFQNLLCRTSVIVLFLTNIKLAQYEINVKKVMTKKL